LKKFLRPIDLAKVVGVSTQVVRMYEEIGFIPAAPRSSKGYRLYTPHHLEALQVARASIAGYGWQNAHQIMQAIHREDLPEALAVIDAYHANIHKNRRELEETLRILRATSSTIQPLTKGGERHHYRTSFRIKEAAQSAEVRPSALRFWEEQGLLQPTRDKESGYRLYDAEQVRNIQIIALLRKANYNTDVIRTVLNQLATGTPEQALIAAENRLKELTEASRQCVAATAILWHYVEKNFPQLRTIRS
jgi:DNA-binding transcriptional MerR regulator